ncbi:MAG: hypothetical protein NTW04_06080 [Elusimicrobia bacterium]|nr:hypothetical protein [Elusimicrobiota bacterium]
MKIKKMIVSAVALAGLCAGLAVLQARAEDGPCSADIASLCSAETHKALCLWGNESKLSEPCRIELKAKEEKFDQNHPCWNFAEKHCRALPNRWACMHANRGTLPPACGQRLGLWDDRIRAKVIRHKVRKERRETIIERRKERRERIRATKP